MGVLLPSTHTNNLGSYTGVIQVAPWVTSSLQQSRILMSPSAELTGNKEVESNDYISQESPGGLTLDTMTTSTKYIFNVVCNRLSDPIISFWMGGSLTTGKQSAGSVTGEVSGYAFPNRSVQLGGNLNSGAGVFGVSAVSVSSYEGANATARVNSTAYVVGDVYIPAVANNHWYMCTVAGTSGASPPTFTTDGTDFTDGTATFIDMGLIAYTVTTDYEVDATYGVVNILDTGAIADAVSRVPTELTDAGKTFRLEIDYTRAAKSFPSIGVSTIVDTECSFWFYEDNAKVNNSVWYAKKAKIQSDGELNLKTGTEYAGVSFTITALKSGNDNIVTRNGVPV